MTPSPTSYHFDFCGDGTLAAHQLDLICQSVGVVWHHHVRRARSFQSLIDDGFSRFGTGILGETAKSSGMLTFWVGALRRFAKEHGASLHSTLIMKAAHEAMHLVQIHRGDDPSASRVPATGQLRPDYWASPAEQEAMEAELHALKAFDPSITGVIEPYRGASLSTLPEETMFTDIDFEITINPLSE